MFFFAAAFLMVASVADPGGSLTGVVIGADGNPISGATVRIAAPALPKSIEVVTKADGIYAAKDLAPGKYAIRAELPGFMTVSDVAEVVSADTTERDYVLKPARIEMITGSGSQPHTSMTFDKDRSVVPSKNGRDVVAEVRGTRASPVPDDPAATDGSSEGSSETSDLGRYAAMENRSLTAERRQYFEQESDRSDVVTTVDAAFRANNIPRDAATEKEVRIAYLGAEASILSSSPDTTKSQLKAIEADVIGQYVKHRGTPRQRSMAAWISLSLRGPEFATLYLSAAPPPAVPQKVWLDEDTYGPGYREMPQMNIYKVETLVRHDVTIDAGHHHCSFIVQMQTKNDSETLVCPHLKAQ
jgi:hypothetical protein